LGLQRQARFFRDSSLAEKKTDHDRNADFGHYKTNPSKNVHTQNPLWVDRIKAAVNSALAAKGWTEVESGGDVSIIGSRSAADNNFRETALRSAKH
jgi:hypothetical protein